MSRRVVIPVVIATALIVAVAGWMWLRRDNPRPASFHAESTSAFYASIDTRQSDPAPLTLQEVFTPATENIDSMRRQATEQFTDCSDALWGASATGCTQALRATYQGASMTGQFVIFNMTDGRAADALVAALGKDGFVRQGIVFDPAGSRAQARAMGHYVTVSWAGGRQSVERLTAALIALDGLGRVVQSRIVNAT
ncbi:hypothetical protein ABZ897_05425 [Nonomuraea sp. NPDC046802]|uniref:hypothetical protein n=1 Tax=Nonomuraea sp. NPDC046802 TaxID=3154919 RepID=UPI0033C66ADB